MGAVSVANGVVYARSFLGMMVAMDAKTGAVLWTFQRGGSVLDAPAIAEVWSTVAQATRTSNPANRTTWCSLSPTR